MQIVDWLTRNTILKKMMVFSVLTQKKTSSVFHEHLVFRNNLLSPERSLRQYLVAGCLPTSKQTVTVKNLIIFNFFPEVLCSPEETGRGKELLTSLANLSHLIHECLPVCESFLFRFDTVVCAGLLNSD